ncbi:MAG TPA: sugar transferase [Verrucomicrobiae bacterium]|nr:sugar transferase [Verrucomicrobiae bacterium]
MKALLICPAERERVAALKESVPLANLPILGKSLIAYWLEHLASRGAREVYVLAADRPEQVRALVGDGARWGLRVCVFPEIREPTPAEALAKFGAVAGNGWLPAPDNARVMDCLPGLPDSLLFTSYTDWFAALTQWLPRAATPDRIGVREIKPGVWAGLHARLAPDAELRAPCWLGANVRIGSGAVIGPMVVVENRAMVEPRTEISHSVIGPETFVGQCTDIHHSIAWGNLLTNWKLDSCIRVADPFLLSSLNRKNCPNAAAGLLGRTAALLAILLTLPLALAAMLKAWLRGQPAMRPLIAVRPRSAATGSTPVERLIYHELTGPSGWLRRWPELWKIVRGDFSWVGNRPLKPHQAASLTNAFERLWLAAPVGLISLADVEGCTDFHSVETRAHASYYAAKASRCLNWGILACALFLLVLGFPYSQVREQFARLLQPEQLEEGRTSH